MSHYLTNSKDRVLEPINFYNYEIYVHNIIMFTTCFMIFNVL